MQMTLNGAPVSCDVDPCVRLIDLLRDDLGAKSVKEGCGEGECGACTVLLDGEPVNACLVLAAQADGCRITTVEGLSKDDDLHPVQRAFAETGAVQCGFCTPGFLLATVALLRENARPSDVEIVDALAGHLCRCTGYRKIVDAVRRAAELMTSSDAEAPPGAPGR
jgi:carbon-monoxide dehydrogenase small subunit